MTRTEVSNFADLASLPGDDDNEPQDIIQNFGGYFSHLLFAILVLARFWQTRANCGPKIIIHCHPLIQTAKIIINYHVEFELAQTT